MRGKALPGGIAARFEPAPRAPRKGSVIVRAVALSVILGALGVLATFWWLGESITSVARVPVWALAAGAALTAVNYLCGAVRLSVLTRMTGQPVGFGRSLRAYGLGLLSAAITPGGTGQAPAVVLSLVRDGVPASQAWSVNVYVWVVDLFFLTWSVPIGLVVLGHSTDLLRGTSPVLLAVLLAFVFLVLNYLLAFRLHWVKAIVGPVMRLAWLRRWRAATLDFLDRVAEATGQLSRHGLGLQLVLHVLTAGLYIATYMAFYVIVLGLGGHPPLLPTIAAVQLPMVVSFLFPTPGGAGLLEIAAASLFTAEGSNGQVGAAIFAWRLLTYYSRYAIGPAFGGAVLLRPRPAARRDPHGGDDGSKGSEPPPGPRA
ncbi:MAG: lysylphosphatidylglycerol synthase transmembrane domain-containing protein, partial [Deinococcales bacterium]